MLKIGARRAKPSCKWRGVDHRWSKDVLSGDTSVDLFSLEKLQ